MRPLSTFVTGFVGVGGVEIAQNVQIPTTTEVKDIVSIVIQLAIGVATLLGMFKKKKKAESPQNTNTNSI